MSKVPVGLNDISVYVPQPELDVGDLAARRGKESPELATHLKRAQQTTGQVSFRFPALWEDTTTLAAEAARRLLDRVPPDGLAALRFLAVGTETAVDHSKPVAAYVQGILQRDGLGLPSTMATLQVQHACAGGALAMLSVGALLAASAQRRESGLVICSDIARYKTESTAEITQGAGAVALHISPDPALLTLDLETQGFDSNDVDDFFRPIGEITPSVRGGYSMKCYVDSLEAAFADHCRRRGEDPAEVLKQTEIFVLHAPFRNMPLVAMQKLLAAHLGFSAEQAEDFLEVRGFFGGIDPVARVGNTYTASLFLSLAFTLYDRSRVLGDRIVGKKVLLVSYGSGNTMAVVSGTVAAGAPAVIESWNLESVWDSARAATDEEYDQWVDRPLDNASYQQALDRDAIPEDAVCLGAIREDGYRIYEVNHRARVELAGEPMLAAAAR